MLAPNLIVPRHPSTSPTASGLDVDKLWTPPDVSKYDQSSLDGAAYILGIELATTGILSDQGGQHEDYYEQRVIWRQKYGDYGPWVSYPCSVLKLPRIELVSIVPDATPGDRTALLDFTRFFVAQALENGEPQFEETEIELANRIRYSYPVYRIALGTVVGVGL